MRPEVERLAKALLECEELFGGINGRHSHVIRRVACVELREQMIHPARQMMAEIRLLGAPDRGELAVLWSAMYELACAAMSAGYSGFDGRVLGTGCERPYMVLVRTG